MPEKGDDKPKDAKPNAISEKSFIVFAGLVCLGLTIYTVVNIHFPKYLNLQKKISPSELKVLLQKRLDLKIQIKTHSEQISELDVLKHSLESMGQIDWLLNLRVWTGFIPLIILILFLTLDKNIIPDNEYINGLTKLLTIAIIVMSIYSLYEASPMIVNKSDSATESNRTQLLKQVTDLQTTLVNKISILGSELSNTEVNLSGVAQSEIRSVNLTQKPQTSLMKNTNDQMDGLWDDRNTVKIKIDDQHTIKVESINSRFWLYPAILFTLSIVNIPISMQKGSKE